MIKLFSSEQREYDLDPTRVVKFVDELQKDFNAETKLRRESGMEVTPMGTLYISDERGYNSINVAKQGGRYQRQEEFFGKTINVNTEVFKTSYVLGVVNLGKLIMAEDGKKLTLTIQPLEKLATDPNAVYAVAERYSA